jgi:hypothetical protein
MSKRWATPTWYFLHVLIEKIDAVQYKRISKEYIDLMVNIFNNLPCPDCKTHAVSYSKKNNIYAMNTRALMKQYMFDFHNHVNKNIGKRLQNNKIYDLYSKMNTVYVCNLFIRQFFLTNPLSQQFNGWQSNLKQIIVGFLNKNKSYLRV